jgi:hypothetical protein
VWCAVWCGPVLGKAAAAHVLQLQGCYWGSAGGLAWPVLEHIPLLVVSRRHHGVVCCGVWPSACRVLAAQGLLTVQVSLGWPVVQHTPLLQVTKVNGISVACCELWPVLGKTSSSICNSTWFLVPGSSLLTPGEPATVCGAYLGAVLMLSYLPGAVTACELQSLIMVPLILLQEPSTACTAACLHCCLPRPSWSSGVLSCSASPWPCLRVRRVRHWGSHQDQMGAWRRTTCAAHTGPLHASECNLRLHRACASGVMNARVWAPVRFAAAAVRT